MHDSQVSVYDREPCYPPVGSPARYGWPAAVDLLPPGTTVLGVDGPPSVDWDRLISGLSQAVAAGGSGVRTMDMRAHSAPWDVIVERTASHELVDDPDFAALSAAEMPAFFADPLPRPETAAGTVTIVYGPGAALVDPEVLWYADLPKRFAEALVAAGSGRNLGQRPDGTVPATTRRLFYIDWPVLDRHRDLIAPDIAVWLDMENPAHPQWLDGETLRRTLAELARRPFRTRPTFNTTSWGGHWAQERLGFNAEAPSTALGYELIAPESGILIGERGGARVEVPLQLAVAQEPETLMGSEAHRMFGTSFPIRFDYLDTFGGGNLSVHCHPQPAYMRKVFGWPYTQHETYYMMVGGPGRKVFLGLRGDVDVQEFRDKADDAFHHGTAFDIEDFVQTFPADPHQLFLIPAGTPHGSGEGNVVLEISATPYLYSLRFYDWLRRDGEGRQRPVHVEHAFSNLDAERSGRRVRDDLVQRPRVLLAEPTWREEVIGALPEMFFEVRRIELSSGASARQQTGDRFHILNVVEGDGVLVTTAAGDRHRLAYAETLIIPAAVGGYSLTARGSGPVRVVKALIR